MSPISHGTRIGLSAFGALFFLFFVALAIAKYRAATDRDGRREQVGQAIPGLAGLLIVAAAWSPWRGLAVASAVVALPVLVVGRAVYELAVFHRPGEK